MDNSDVETPLLYESWCESETQLKQPNGNDTRVSSYSTLVPNDLPDGKKYHLFVSNSSEDDERVKELVKGLENDYCLKCMFAQRNFVGGVFTETNIDLKMKESMKFLAIITPNYAESGWCAVERRAAIGNLCVIPVMLEKCEVPAPLKGISYIDATLEDVDVPAKIVEAFFDETLLDNSLYAPNQRRVENLKHQENGGFLFDIFAEDVSKKYALSKKWEFPKLSEDDEIKLTKAGTKARTFVISIIQKLNNENLLQFYGVLFKLKALIILTFLCYCVIILTDMSLLYMLVLIKKIDDIPNYVYQIFVFLNTILILCLAPLIRRKIRRKFIAKARLLVRENVKTSYKETKLLVFLRSEEPPVNYLKESMMKDSDSVFDEDAETELDFLIDHAIWRICSWKCLPADISNKHSTDSDRQCLCRLIDISV